MNGSTLGYSYLDDKEHSNAEVSKTKTYNPSNIIEKLKTKKESVSSTTITAFDDTEEENYTSSNTTPVAPQPNLQQTQPIIPLIQTQEAFHNNDMNQSNQGHYTLDSTNTPLKPELLYDFGRHMTPSSTQGEQETPQIQEKINYIIHMLEQNRQMRTENVNEEMVMYFFLGFFILYISDNFVKMGKYTR